MRRFIFSIALLILLVIITGCADDGNDESMTDSAEYSSNIETTEEDIEVSNTDDVNDITPEETVKEDSDRISSENIESNVDDKQDKDLLSQYTSEQIEYARVWLQLGANQDVDELYVQHIPAETPLNPHDDTSLVYPEDVIQLAGSRLVDGSVTYSGNGNGTINVYEVPLRWDGNYPAGEEFYKEIIENTEIVYINPNDDEEVIRLINLLEL